MSSASLPQHPYKYLDYYGEADSSIFFGRRLEIETLLADIVDTRLVVLFAKTGTGKSSLINAGVRPRLHKLRYKTVVSRVGRDPTKSIAAALTAEGLLPAGAPWMPFAQLLMHVVKLHERPLVVFVDQFEEFFLAQIAGAFRHIFIQEVSVLARTPKSGVHLVFSMREDFLADMDMFRDEIPTIFQKESQLRLRAFTRDQAREAVEGPSRVFTPPFRYAAGLVDRIVAELPADDGLILPVTLQIVCDTLWRDAGGGTIEEVLYDRLGGASGILAGRIMEDIGRLDPLSLVALEKLIPYLATRDWTKQSRTLSELQTLTSIDPGTLALVTGKLSDLHLLRVDAREAETVVEWVSDYVAFLSSTLGPSLSLLWLRKVRDVDAQSLPPERIMAILEQSAIVPQLERADWDHLLRAAARSRDTLGLWFARARANGQNVWPMIEAALNDPQVSIGSAYHLMLFLGEHGDGPPIDILAAQVRRRDRARTALRALGATRSPRAVEFLQPALADPELHAAALDALQTLGHKDALRLAERARKESRSWSELLFGRRPRALKGMDEEFWPPLLDAVTGRYSAVLIGPRFGTHRPRLAAGLAEQFHYPFADKNDLDAVMSYVAMTGDRSWSKSVRTLLDAQHARPGAEYAALARVPIEVFVTTDPTEELTAALVGVSKRPVPLTSGYVSQDAKDPVVIYLHGTVRAPDATGVVHETESGELVDLLHRVLTGDSHRFQLRTLIVVGFEPSDPWLYDFRHTFSGSLPEGYSAPRMLPAVIVAEPPEVDDRAAEGRAREYFRQQAYSSSTTFFWGTPEEFVKELLKRLP